VNGPYWRDRQVLQMNAFVLVEPQHARVEDLVGDVAGAPLLEPV
jgi:hypothetical protein